MAINTPPLPLEDIIQAPAQGFWPLAPGWWVVLILLLALISWASFHFISKLRFNAYFRKQNKTVDTLEKLLRSNQLDAQELYKVLNRILKLFLIHYSKDSSVVPLTGMPFKRWIENLTPVAAELNPIFDDSIYKPENEFYQETIDQENAPQKKSLAAIQQFRILLKNLHVIFSQSGEAPS